MGRILLIFLFLFGIQTFTQSQHHLIDSLESQLVQSKTDSFKVDLLNRLADRYLTNQPQKSRQYAEEALNISETIDYKPGKAIALNRLGEYEFRQSNYAKAVEFATASLRLAEQINDPSIMAMAYRVLGNINTFGFKRFDQALQYQLKAFDIYKKLNDKRNIASFCGNVTWIYGTTGQNLEEGHRLADLGIHLSDSLKDYQLLSYNYNSKGLLYLQQNELDSALSYFILSNITAEKSSDNAVISYNKSIIGEIYLLQEKYNSAIDYFNQALQESGELNLREVSKNSLNGLAKSFAALKDYQRAYQYHLQHDELSNALLNAEITQKALLTEFEFEEEKRKTRIAELELANKQARKERIIYTILFGVILLAMGIITLQVVKNNRERLKANNLLMEKNKEIALQNEQLMQTNAIKDKLFSIISHDIRTPLASLKGLLTLLLHDNITEREFRELSPKLNNLVVNTSETVENLFQWSQAQLNGWTRQPKSVNLFDLAQRCIALFTEPAKVKGIQLANKISKEKTIFADENQIELIIRNLINNAIKFTNSGGQVIIDAQEMDNTISILVTDTGMGMNEDQIKNLFSKEKIQTTQGTFGEKGTGLGLQLCKEMAENNGGTIIVSSTPGKGSLFTVSLKARP